MLARQIANRIRQVREELGWTQNELERRSGLALEGRTSGVISRIESCGGERVATPKLVVDSVLAIAIALNVDVGWLITGRGSRKPRT